MAEFPDLKVPYAVFHDFDVTAPSWVMMKRWIRTDDSETEAGRYSPLLSPRTAGFADIIESPPDGPKFTDTVFDIARVR
jgi:hypothetical protein